jgi:murein hydrolase activator
LENPTKSSPATFRSARLAQWCLWVLLALLTYPQSIVAQSSAKLDSLYDLQRKLDKEIKFLTTARDTAKAHKEDSYAELQLINKQVGLREQLLSGLQGQMTELDKSISSTSAVIASLEADVETIKAEFARLMVVTYKAFNRANTGFYIFSAASLSQGYRRAQYFKAITRMQESQMKLIKRTKAFLAQKKIVLEQQKLEKQKVVAVERIERGKLVALKDEQKRIFEKLKSDEINFNKSLVTSQGERAKIEEEIRKELERIRIANNDKIKKGGAASIDIVNALNKDFSTNKGKFPWPVPMPNASVTRHFGKQMLPNSQTEIDVQGIDLTTLPGQPVRAVFSGTVESVMAIPGQGKMVIISHGTYYTVFANLNNVSVKVNEKVGMLTPLGTARTDPASGETKVYFQMNQDKMALDPEQWLAKKG